MTITTPAATPIAPAPHDASASASPNANSQPTNSRDARLKAALRANLLRRKQQHNARQQDAPSITPNLGGQ